MLKGPKFSSSQLTSPSIQPFGQHKNESWVSLGVFQFAHNLLRVFKNIYNFAKGMGFIFHRDVRVPIFNWFPLFFFCCQNLHNFFIFQPIFDLFTAILHCFHFFSVHFLFFFSYLWFHYACSNNSPVIMYKRKENAKGPPTKWRSTFIAQEQKCVILVHFWWHFLSCESRSKLYCTEQVMHWNT